MEGNKLITKLMAAIHAKDTHQIRLLVENGAALNQLCLPGVLPLVWAANSGNLEICRFLVTLGASMGDTDGRNVPSPLSNALSLGLNLSVRTLIQLGCDVNARSCEEVRNRSSVFQENYTLVHVAVIRHNFEALKMLLNAGANINLPDSYGNTPIHFACDGRNSLSLKKILQYTKVRDSVISKPDLNVQNSFGETPLMCAVSSQNTDAVLTLIKGKVSLNAENRMGYTALHCAVLHGTEEVLLALLRAGCATNMPHWPETPLHLAASKADETFCDILVEFGANPFELFQKDDTLLHVAARRCRIELMDFALRAGVSVNSRNSDGHTSLMIAADRNCVGAIQQLVRHRASLIAEDNNRETALVHGIRSDSTECAVYLMAEGSTRSPKCYELAMSNPRTLQFLLLTEVSSWKDLLVTHKDNPCLNSDRDLLQWWQTTACNSHSLKHICRLAIRQVLMQLMRGQGILDAIEQLPLPGVIKQYLSFKREVIDRKLYIFPDCDPTDEDDQL